MSENIRIEFIDNDKKLYEEMKNNIYRLVNQIRKENGLQQLCLNHNLEKISQIYSESKFTCMKMSHLGCSLFQKNKKNLIEIVKDVNYNWNRLGENIAFGYKTPEEVFKAWLENPGHRKNILNPNFKDIGIGIQGQGDKNIYWVQIFGSQKEITPTNI